MKLFLYKQYIKLNNFICNLFPVEDWRNKDVLKKYNVQMLKASFSYTLKGINYHFNKKFVPDWLHVLENEIKQPDVWFYNFDKAILIDKGVILHKKNTVLLESTFFQREYLNKLKIAKLLVINSITKPKDELNNVIPLMNRLSNNYFHWTTESLTRIALLDEKFPNLKENYTILINHDAPKFVEESLTQIIKWPQDKIHRYTDKKISWVKNCIQISYPVVRNQNTQRYYAYPAYIFQTLSKLAEKNISKNNLDEQLPENFIISRKKVGSRNLVNEDLLLNHFPTLNLKIVFLELLPFHQQVALFNNAKLIIAPHGAGLTNLTYCKPDVIVYEIYPIGRNFNQTSSFYQISKSINIRYHLIMTPPINKNEEMMLDEELLEKITELNKKYLLI